MPALLTRRSRRPKLLDDRGYGFADALGVAEIAAEGEGSTSSSARDLDGLFGFGLRVEVGDGDVGAVLGQGEGDGAADAFCRSGDERGLPGERLLHGRVTVAADWIVLGVLVALPGCGSGVLRAPGRRWRLEALPLLSS